MTDGRTLGVDFGESRVGTALSDPLGMMAQPFELIERESDAQVADEIDRIVRAHEVTRVVVGVPISLSGRDSPQTRRTRNFIRRLRKRLEVKVDTWDERLSTEEADRAMREMGFSPKKQKEKRDIIAAQLILQGYMDWRQHRSARLS
ncbi:MAG: Holliday junction resolvase RuvX [bacterium]|nr:Holliday junction resolvase RuvX [bacterium]